jgi:hypothetical protein
MDLVNSGTFPFPKVNVTHMNKLNESHVSATRTLEQMIQFRELRLIEELKNITQKGVVEQK